MLGGLTEAVRGGNSDQAAQATSGGSASACAMAHVPRKAAWVEAVEGVLGSARGALLKSWEDTAGNQVGTDNGHVGRWLGATAGGSHGHQRSSCNPSQSAMCCLEASCVYLAPVVTASLCHMPPALSLRCHGHGCPASSSPLLDLLLQHTNHISISSPHSPAPSLPFSYNMVLSQNWDTHGVLPARPLFPSLHQMLIRDRWPMALMTLTLPKPALTPHPPLT